MIDCPNCNTSMEDDAHFCPECGQKMKTTAADDVAGNKSAMQTIGGFNTLDDTQTRGGNRSSSPELEAGTEFADRYVIEDVIGRGGMGVVYRAEDKLANKTVALKLIRPERLGGGNAVQRLIAEGITARDIRHENVIAVYDVGEAEGQPFVSMEYLKGKSLGAWHGEKIQAREDVPLRVGARIVAEILDGLTAAHKAGVIHRDLKPENIILDGEPTADAAPLKILDFGIARAANGAFESGTGTGLGTPRYMAPEQIRNPDTVGPSADLYSLSVLFYELLVNNLPVGHWQPPSGGRTDIPRGIDDLIEKGLSNRQAMRPQSAAAYRKRLVSAVNLQPVKKKPPVRKDTDNSSQPSKALMWVGGITVAVLLLGGIASLMEPDGPTDPCAHLIYNDVAYEKCVNPMAGNFDEPVIPVVINPEPKIDDRAAAAAAAKAARIERERLAEIERKRLAELERLRTMYRSLNGQWVDDDYSVATMRIDSSGGFSGSAYDSFSGDQVTITGSFKGMNGNYSMFMPSLSQTVNGSFVFDGGCHIAYTLLNPVNGMVADQGRMHVNHQPGAPCP